MKFDVRYVTKNKNKPLNYIHCCRLWFFALFYCILVGLFVRARLLLLLLLLLAFALPSLYNLNSLEIVTNHATHSMIESAENLSKNGNLYLCCHFLFCSVLRWALPPVFYTFYLQTLLYN